jgi:hypothetical protein
LASIQNPSKFSRFTPKGTPKLIGVRLADLWAKVMMAPEPVRPSLVQGVEPLQPSVAELVSLRVSSTSLRVSPVTVQQPRGWDAIWAVHRSM